MKRILYIIFLFVYSLGMTSCNDLLNPEPENSVTFYNFFENEEDVVSAMNGLHSLFRGNFANMPYIEGAGEFADEIKSTMDLMRGLVNLDGSLITDSEHLVTSWSGYYSVISLALVILENLDRANLPEERYNYYRGQALFFKAYMYFRVIQLWGDCPYVDVSYELDARGRMDWKVVLDTVIRDAEEARDLLKPWSELKDNKGASVTTKQIPGKEAANALLAHMYAWKGSLLNDNEALQKGIDAATTVIKADGVSLASDPEEVCTGVMMGGHSESLFEVELVWTEIYMQGYFNMESLYQGFPIVPYTAPADIISKYLHVKAESVLEMYKGGDLRKDAYFFKTDSMATVEEAEGWAFMQKRREIVQDTESNPDNPSTWYRNLDGNVILFRLADIILLRAEMYAKKGDRDLALIDLQTIRDRAQAPAYTEAEGDLYYVIFKEREKELIAERHRRFDIVRTGFYGEMSEAWGRLTAEDVAEGAVYLPVYSKAFNDNSLMRQNRWWAKQW